MSVDTTGARENPLLRAALGYAARGFPVFPCQLRGKVPLVETGFKAATTDPEQISELWKKWKLANIGMPTGAASDIAVLDVDQPNGEESLAKLRAEHGPLPQTCEVQTGRGRQLWFSYPSIPIRNSAGALGAGLDIRGEGGYVIAPPSIHPNGAHYAFSNDLECEPMPEWLILLASQSTTTAKAGRLDNGAERILEGQRNAHLTSLKGSMRRRGMSQDAIAAALLTENSKRCEPPLPEADVARIAASVSRYSPGAASPPSNVAPQPPEHFAKLECFAGIQPKPLRWVWQNRFPAGKLSLLVGDPDKGKSLITVDITARITTGRPFPDGAPCERGSVIILSAEDDAVDTIRPRLEAASADLSHVHWLEAVRVVQRDGKQGERTFSLESGIAALYDAIKQCPDVRLIIIDPISAYLGGTESHKNSEVRGLLAPLKDFTARTGVTVMGITHFRKSSGPAIHRSIDSTAFAAAARAVWGVAEDPEDTNKRVMVRIKGNLCRDPGGLAYRIEESPSGIPHIAWEQGSVTLRADDVLGELDSREDSSERHEAAQWLKSFLAGGPKLAREVKKQATEARFSWATVRRAQVILGICKTKSGFQGSWEWSLPQPTSPKDAQPQHAEVSTFGENLISKGENASQPPKGAQPAQVSNLGREGSSFAPPSKGYPVATPKPVGVDKKWRF